MSPTCNSWNDKRVEQSERLLAPSFRKISSTQTINNHFEVLQHLQHLPARELKMYLQQFVLNVCFLSAVFLCFIQKSNALDASFIPNDENEPLPLSKKYRDSLRKLCVLLKTDSSRIPVEIAQKRRVLEKVCLKLEKDDNNIEAASTHSTSKGQQLLYGLIGLGSGYYLWTNRRWLTTKINDVVKKSQQQGQVLGHSNNLVASADIPATIESTASSIDLVDPGVAIPVEYPVIVSKVEFSGSDKVTEARSARLKRFAEMNNVNTLKTN
jgi:hypothetical protein